MSNYDLPRRDRVGAPWSVLVGMLLAAVLIGIVLWSLGVFQFGKQPPPAHDPDAKLREVAPRGPLGAEEAERVAVAKNCTPSVVNVDTLVYEVRGFNGGQEERQGTGSGFFWDDDGRIVTNFHVIRDALGLTRAGQVVVSPGRRIIVTLASGEAIEARLVGIAPDNDLAVIQLKQLPQNGVKKITVGSSGDLEVGYTVYAIGSPFGQSRTFTHGIISALDRSIQSPTQHIITGVIQVDAPINPGNSGGPLLDREGRLIGVNTAITTPSGGSVGLGYAIPVDTVNRIVTSLIKTGAMPSPTSGPFSFSTKRNCAGPTFPRAF